MDPASYSLSSLSLCFEMSHSIFYSARTKFSRQSVINHCRLQEADSHGARPMICVDEQTRMDYVAIGDQVGACVSEDGSAATIQGVSDHLSDGNQPGPYHRPSRSMTSALVATSPKMPPSTAIIANEALCKLRSLEAQASLTVIQRYPRSVAARKVELTHTSVVTPVKMRVSMLRFVSACCNPV